jgi:hypothetical protein
MTPPAISGCSGAATEPDLVSVGIAVRYLAHAVRVGFSLRRVDSSLGNLRDDPIEVIDEERVSGVTSVFRLLNNVDVAMLGKFPHSLYVFWNECRSSQEPFVPLQRRCVVSNPDACEQIEIFFV